MNQNFIALAQNKFKLSLFLISKLPAAYFSGVRLVSINENQAIVKIPYKWFSRNPFKSTYFACLSMAAEMSTGLLAMGYTFKSEPAISMLVVHIEGGFYKKAQQNTYFTCADGAAIKAAIQQTLSSGEAVTCICSSTGKDSEGNLIARFKVTWSFKVKSKPHN